ncbi:MAG: NADH-quinone oxidoreductase subunit J, partial [Acidilobaceae archaeon]
MVWEAAGTILAALLSVSLVLVALLVVTVKDMVYASILLAVLGALTASLVALLGYYLVAAFIIIVYVGAAVMFIIITVSMLGGGGLESRDYLKGAAVASLSLAVLFAVFLSYLRVPEVGIPL